MINKRKGNRIMDKLQWLKERQKGIGGSDVGAVMGVNRWKTAFEVYVEKTEEINEVPETQEPAYWGSSLKEMAAREFTRRTGKKVRRDSRHLVHKEYPFMRANIDRRVIGENSLLLCKTANAFGGREWEGEEIPAGYILQCQHYMAVTDTDKCYVAVLIGGQKFLIKEVNRDEELIEMMIEAEKDFWLNHVEKRVPPALDGSPSADKYLRSKYPNSKASLEVDLKAEFKDKISMLLGLKDNIRALEDEAKTLENNIKNELGEAEKGFIDNFIVQWKAVLSNRVDSKALKDKYPEIYREVSKESISRRFEIREV